MTSHRLLLLCALVLPSAWSFTAAPLRTRSLSKAVSPRGFPTVWMSDEEVDPAPPAEMMSTPSVPPPVKRMDPLLASLTRDDAPPPDPNAPTKSIPLLGEVTLDKNLFVVAPIAAFAVLGILSFFVVAANSGDAIVQALNDVNEAVLNPQTPSPLPDGECRGLCSNQEQDVEGLRNFMNSFK